MKTADRILQTARQLFNRLGEHNVAASDIAMELGMSPGNLYYHFKGKDSIHLALFAQLQRELVGLLGAPLTEPSLFDDTDDDAPIERCWLFLTVVLEQMLEYRYLYQNPNDLMRRYPEIDRGVRRLVRLQRAACASIAQQLLAQNDKKPTATSFEPLVEAMNLSLTYWLSYDQLSHPEDSDTLIVHRGVLQLLSFCAPYLGDEQQGFYRECEQLYAHMVANDNP